MTQTLSLQTADVLLITSYGKLSLSSNLFTLQ